MNTDYETLKNNIDGEYFYKRVPVLCRDLPEAESAAA